MFHMRSESKMTIRVLLADDSDVMRSVIARILTDDPDLEIIGVAASFAETLRLTAVMKPDILIMDLHMADEREYPPETVKGQLLQTTDCIVAMSLWNDTDAKALAESMGARMLLDKANLYSTLIPAIKLFCPNVDQAQHFSGNGNPAVAKNFQ